MGLVLSNEYVTPAELTGYVREALADMPQNAFGLSEFLPDNGVDDIDFRADVGGGGLARVAAYRAWDAESPISGRKGVAEITGALPPISEKRRLGEYDRLKMRRLPSGITNALFNDAVDLARNITARVEVARGQLLSTGKVTIAENGLVLTADFGRAANHTQTAGILWGAAGSTPLENLLAWQDIYVATNGRRPGRILTDQSVLSTLMRNASVRTYVLGDSTSGRIVTLADVQALFTSFGLPALEVYEAQVEGANGAPVDILPRGRVLFLPPAGGPRLGETLWGVTAEALDADYDIDATEAPGIVVGSYSDKDPVGLWTKASAVAFPIAPNTNLTLSATVL